MIRFLLVFYKLNITKINYSQIAEAKFSRRPVTCEATKSTNRSHHSFRKKLNNTASYTKTIRLPSVFAKDCWLKRMQSFHNLCVFALWWSRYIDSRLLVGQILRSMICMHCEFNWRDMTLVIILQTLIELEHVLSLEFLDNTCI